MAQRVNVWSGGDARVLVTTCRHGRTRTTWPNQGPPPDPASLTGAALVGHAIRVGCRCCSRAWGRIDGHQVCLVRTAGLERVVSDEDLASMGQQR